MLPDEILIADDGSGEDTRLVIDRLRKESPVPLLHIWHEDNGFRLSAIRNKAIVAATGDYIIQIDGDIVMHHRFIADHVRCARRGYYSVGSRVFQSEQRTECYLKSGKGLRKGGLNRRWIPWLTPLFYGEHKDPMYVRGCNMAMWRNDLLAVNGYNEDIHGWGLEDSEISLRLQNYGLRKRFLKCAAIQYHLHHPDNSRDRIQINDTIMKRALDTSYIWADNGIIKQR